MKALFIMEIGNKDKVTEMIKIRVDMRMVLHKTIILDAATILLCNGLMGEVNYACNGQYKPAIDDYQIEFSTTIPIFAETGI